MMVRDSRNDITVSATVIDEDTVRYGGSAFVRVIRCRDCGYISKTLAQPEPYEDSKPFWYCLKFGDGCHPNGFCAWAERDA